RTGASEMSAIRLKRWSVATPRSIASGARRFMSPPPDPRRTISFSRVMTSKRASPVTRATTRWIELVPTSMAARARCRSSSEVAAVAALEDPAPERLDAFEHGAGLGGRVGLVTGAVPEEGDQAFVEVTGREGEAVLLLIVLAGEVAPGPHAGEAVA